MLSLKQKIHAAFVALQTEKILQLKATIGDLSYSVSNETKSTAGDKHETALAHLQTAVAQANIQLQELQHQLTLLQTFDPCIVTTDVRPGSLVRTNKNNLYITAAIGKATVDEITVNAISSKSPAAIQLIGKTKGNEVIVNAMNFVIQEIL